MLVCGGLKECQMLNRLMFFSPKQDGRIELRRVGSHGNVRVPHLVSIRDSWQRLENIIRQRGHFLGNSCGGQQFLMDDLVELVEACLSGIPQPISAAEFFLLEWIDSTTISSHKYLTERVRIIDPSGTIFPNRFSPVFFFWECWTSSGQLSVPGEVWDRRARNIEKLFGTAFCEGKFLLGGVLFLGDHEILGWELSQTLAVPWRCSFCQENVPEMFFQLPDLNMASRGYRTLEEHCILSAKFSHQVARKNPTAARKSLKTCKTGFPLLSKYHCVIPSHRFMILPPLFHCLKSWNWSNLDLVVTLIAQRENLTKDELIALAWQRLREHTGVAAGRNYWDCTMLRLCNSYGPVVFKDLISPNFVVLFRCISYLNSIVWSEIPLTPHFVRFYVIILYSYSLFSEIVFRHCGAHRAREISSFHKSLYSHDLLYHSALFYEWAARKGIPPLSLQEENFTGFFY